MPLSCVSPGFDAEFLKWCVDRLGSGERILPSRWIAEEMGVSSHMVGLFLQHIVAVFGGMVGSYKVERWNNRSARNVAIWRVSYAHPVNKSLGGVG